MTYDHNNERIFIFGGRGGDSLSKELNDLWSFDLNS